MIGNVFNGLLRQAVAPVDKEDTHLGAKGVVHDGQPEDEGFAYQLMDHAMDRVRPEELVQNIEATSSAYRSTAQVASRTIEDMQTSARSVSSNVSAITADIHALEPKLETTINTFDKSVRQVSDAMTMLAYVATAAVILVVYQKYGASPRVS